MLQLATSKFKLATRRAYSTGDTKKFYASLLAYYLILLNELHAYLKNKDSKELLRKTLSFR